MTRLGLTSDMDAKAHFLTSRVILAYRSAFFCLTSKNAPPVSV
jgi:hypothetical protein